MASFQTKYRPESLDEFFGNEEIVKALKELFKRPKENLPHSFLFTGLPGGGKTTLAGILKGMVGCSDIDYHYYNAADDRGIDFIRSVREDMGFSPMSGKVKMYVMDEAAKLTNDALTAMLLMTENPPESVFFVLCTSEPIKLSPADKRRLHIYEVKPMDYGELSELCQCVLESEKIKDFPQNLIDEVVKAANGSAGDALKILDQVVDLRHNPEQALTLIQSTNTDLETNAREICKMIISKASGIDRWNKCKPLIKNLKKEPEYIRWGILMYFNAILLNNGGENVALAMECFKDNYYNSKQAGLTLSIYTACMTS